MALFYLTVQRPNDRQASRHSTHARHHTYDCIYNKIEVVDGESAIVSSVDVSGYLFALGSAWLYPRVCVNKALCIYSVNVFE